jgi:hypothetical protein
VEAKYRESLKLRENKWQEAVRNYMVRNVIIILFTKNYYSYEIMEDEMDGRVERMGEMRNAYNILVGKTKRKE